MKQNISIVGAGLAGSLLACYLAKKDFDINVYEKRPDMRKENIDAGKSINLALSLRGIHALKEVGLYDEIKKICIPMFGRMMHSTEGRLTFQPYGKSKDEYINSVSRGELNKKLMSLAESYDNVKLHFNKICETVNFEKPEITFRDVISNKITKAAPDVIIAADGSGSAVRTEMQKLPRFNYSQQYEEYGYKELTIPADNGKHRMEINALHIWPRGSFMLIALPNTNGSYTCTLFLSYEGFQKLDTIEKAEIFFKENFPDAFEMMTDFKNEFLDHPTGYLVTVKCFPWKADGKAVLLGDAAHAIVPFFGQGMNAAFEDCSFLNDFIGKFAPDWNKVFSEFQNSRKINTDAIAELALENFIEMRDLVSDERFLLKKKIGLMLEERFPDKFIPKYSMVTFHRLPYSQALAKGTVQENILNELSEGISSPEQISWQKAEKLIEEYL